MNKIKILSENLIAKIAAGEVVSRPASVVKELIENSIDAGSTDIQIDVAGGGTKRITVIDNGCGIAPDDVKLSIERHATSKISSEADLFNIHTMGFRGEALAAIAAVSKLEIETKANDASILEGTYLLAEEGKVKEIRAAGSPVGTKITAKDLFYNTPARKKFLRSDGVEYGHISAIVSLLSLAHPDISFKLSADGKGKLSHKKTESELGRIIDVISDTEKDSISEFEETAAGLKIKGFISKPGVTKGSSKDIYFYLNRRPIKDRTLQHALLSAYDSYVVKGSYPMAVIYIDINPELVDVNVHPAKSEVRFTNVAMIHDLVSSSVRKNLSGGAKAIPVYARIAVSPPPYSFLTPPSTERKNSRGMPVLDSLGNDNNNLRLIGQLGQTYIVCEEESGKLVIIDQHAAHERLGFNTLKLQLASGKIEEQRLLIPERIELTAKEYAVIIEHLGQISKVGFEIEPFGGSSFMIKSVPSILGDVSLKPLFEKISDELSDFGSSGAVSELLDKLCALIACHRQVRGGDSLSREEMDHLIKDIERENISHCPHGRPAIVRIEPSEIEKWFKR